ncbi:unnamed protein product [Acanthoscelides obtectus]|uniref:EF-hand domain-containing protein n=1 Tax=Acanthoscelides obtectus TaxID=200917 RepID=A0A9P0JYG2_ACAOB|nr:unnamed protein product [Acanthoscelides obtectus]CAK1632026.1 hypothetical protein AOBTE_LOCUS7315 [Acanthoscelides obtectus]
MVVEEFTKRLLERRQQNRAIINGKTWEEREFLAKFPGWNESTVGYLHSLFLSFFKDEDKMLDFKGFLCVLECLGDRSDHSKRLKRFENADSDNDGMIDYTQYLELIYNYDSAPKKSTGHLAKRCYKAADKAQFVNSLPMEKQLEYGLF